MPDSPEIIQISYADPKGQIGTRPRKVRLQQAFEVRTAAPGELSIEFTGNSPFANGAKKMTAGENKRFIAEKVGNFPFKCSLKHNNVTIELGGPGGPASPIGGELEVAC